MKGPGIVAGGVSGCQLVFLIVPIMSVIDGGRKLCRGLTTVNGVDEEGIVGIVVVVGVLIGLTVTPTKVALFGSGKGMRDPT